MKKRVILILCVLAVLLTAVICLPFARKIDTTVTATEYRFNDPAYAVEHTVVICGHDTRNLLGYGVFEGTFAVSGFNDFVGRRVYKTVSAVINLVYNFFLHLSVYIGLVHKINK